MGFKYCHIFVCFQGKQEEFNKISYYRPLKLADVDITKTSAKPNFWTNNNYCTLHLRSRIKEIGSLSVCRLFHVNISYLVEMCLIPI